MNRCNSGTDSKVWMRKGKRIFTAETPEVLAVFVYKEGELMDDIKYMRRALELAKMAEGDTSPNPMVGAVITDSSGKIVGEGYHHKAGQPHAEINALAAAGDKAKGATVYVTLEPCSHYGRTGPCCEALIKAGVKKVVSAVTDPNPLVAGRGLNRLREAGIEVVNGICEDEARKLNEKFFFWITHKRPFVSLKYAMTLDGKIAADGGDSKWITGVEARTYAHYLRKTHDAVIVGKNTVLQDDCELTTRMVEGKNPVRIVLDSKCSLPVNSKILNGEARTIVAVGEEPSLTNLNALQLLKNVEIIKLPEHNGKLDLNALMKYIAEQEITSLLVEGGSEVHGAFLDAGFAERVYAFIAPKIIGGRNALAPVGGNGCKDMGKALRLKDIEYKELGCDLLITGRTERD